LFTERSLKFSEIAKEPPSPSLSPGWLCFARRSPYAAGGLRPSCAHGQMDPGKPFNATWPAPWHLLARTRVPGRSRAATTPRPAQRRCLLRPLAVESPRAKSTTPSHYIAHPGALWPIKTPRNPRSRPFFLFFLLPPLRHGRRDPARADRLAQPHIAPSDHRRSFSTS
jgi:hypothetical protein